MKLVCPDMKGQLEYYIENEYQKWISLDHHSWVKMMKSVLDSDHGVRLNVQQWKKGSKIQSQELYVEDHSLVMEVRVHR